MDKNLQAMRHSLAHITAAAIQKLWPDTKFGVGPVVENGWYYDVEPGTTLTDEDLAKIEAEMAKIIERDEPFEQFDLSIDEAIKWAQDSNQDFKVELLNDLKRAGTTVAKDLDASTLGVAAENDSKVDTVSFYKNGDFTDLCRGPHVESTGKVGAFKLTKVAGAYWRGDETKAQLQRVYGVGFANQTELDDYLKQVEEAKARDHRVLGKELDLFTFSDLVGSGLPLYTPKGAILRDLLLRYSYQLKAAAGFSAVWTPHITKHDLYKQSGHWDKFGDELFLVKSQETDDEFALKPMNCPHHVQIFASRPRSYRDLPVKFMENTTDYRDEKSGELHGLNRVRAFTQDDSHAFVRSDQIEQTAGELVQAAQAMYKELDMGLKFRLSFRDDSDGYLGEAELWQRAQDQLETVAKNNQLDYYIELGEAAFYGPKIDFIAVDGLNREWQVATVQLDFIQPERFELEYTAEDGGAQRPVMIHCALLGSIERFLGTYIEHTAGHWPLWLAPEQVRILTINDAVAKYVEGISHRLAGVVLMEPLKYNELRYTVDDRNESLGKKIREAEEQKVPVMMIVGPKDEAEGVVSIRSHEKGESKIKLEEIEQFLLNLGV